jgi:hypothetical protein
VRVYLSMVRALVRDLGLEDTAEAVRVPRHEPGPPETARGEQWNEKSR